MCWNMHSDPCLASAKKHTCQYKPFFSADSTNDTQWTCVYTELEGGQHTISTAVGRGKVLEQFFQPDLFVYQDAGQ